jgi:hypothetical protein
MQIKIKNYILQLSAHYELDFLLAHPMIWIIGPILDTSRKIFRECVSLNPSRTTSYQENVKKDYQWYIYSLGVLLSRIYLSKYGAV